MVPETPNETPTVTPTETPKRSHPFPFVVPGVIALVFALVAGLIRLPWALPFGESFTMLHGPLMISGFLGTVIGAERAAAIARPWAWLAPVGTGLGALLLLIASNMPPVTPLGVQRAGGLLFTVGAVMLVVIFGRIIRAQPERFNWVMGLGALCFLASNVLLLVGRPVVAAVPFWTVFLVLTIAGERLELNRLMRPRRGASALFAVAAGALLVGALSSLWSLRSGDIILGGAMIVLGGWLVINDIARRTIRMSGVTRYVAAALLSGYCWLAVSGYLHLAHPGEVAGLHYDAALHSLYVGFVLAMIFGHAPIIVPALSGRAVDFRAHFYLPLVLLHGSLLLRIAGDVHAWLPGRRWGGLLNEVALVLFLVILVVAIRRGSR